MLSSREREALHAIEADLRAEDPELAAFLGGGRVPSRTGRRIALAGVLAGVVALLTGLVVLSAPAALAGAGVALVAGGTWLWLSGALRPSQPS
jgi:hypothetical protein